MNLEKNIEELSKEDLVLEVKRLRKELEKSFLEYGKLKSKFVKNIQDNQKFVSNIQNSLKEQENRRKRKLEESKTIAQQVKSKKVKISRESKFPPQSPVQIMTYLINKHSYKCSEEIQRIYNENKKVPKINVKHPACNCDKSLSPELKFLWWNTKNLIEKSMNYGAVCYANGYLKTGGVLCFKWSDGQLYSKPENVSKIISKPSESADKSSLRKETCGCPHTLKKKDMEEDWKMFYS